MPELDRKALKEAKEFMERAGAMLGRGEMPAPATPYAVQWHAAHANVLEALSASEQRERRLREALKIAEAYARGTLVGIIESDVHPEIVETAKADQDTIRAALSEEEA